MARLATVSTPTPPRGERWRHRLGGFLLEAWLPVLLFSLWWVLSADSNSLYFVSLSSILAAFREEWLTLAAWPDVFSSLSNLTMGYLLAVVLGVGCGTLLGLARPVGEALAPVLEFLRAVPGVALLPLGILILGLGTDMKVALILYGALWPILLTTIDGVRSVDTTLRDVASSYRIPLTERVFRIILPAASPQVVSGMRTSLSVAITVVVFSELVGSTEGIGYSILQAQRTFAVPQMWAGMLLLGLLGYALNLAFRAFEHRVLHWHRSMTASHKG